MDGLDEFEKTLAAEKAERDRGEERRRKKPRHRKHKDDDGEDKHRHRSRRHEEEGDEGSNHRSHRHRDEERHKSRRHRDEEEKEEDGHRHKRSRHSKEEDGGSRGHRSSKHSSSKNEHGSDEGSSENREPSSSKSLKRDSWMTAPSAMDIDYVNKKEKEAPAPPPKEPERVLHKRELNQAFHSYKADAPEDQGAREIVADYKFGDEGSQWRMTKLKAIYSTAESEGIPVEEVALKRYGNLQEFDIAREEKAELDRRKLYGEGYSGKDKPNGDFYRERMAEAGSPKQVDSPSISEQEEEKYRDIVAPPSTVPVLDQTALNRLKAQMMKAKLRRDPDAAKLEEEYNKAAAGLTDTGPQTVALGAMENRMLAGSRGEVKAVETKRGQERGTLEENTDMTIEQMVQEERRTRGQAGGEGRRMAERIAKDSQFNDNLDYMDDNAAKLAKRVHKSEVNLKNLAVNEFQKMNKILDACPLCYHEDTGKQPIAPVVSLATRVFLTLPTEPEISEGGAVIVPLAHRTNLLDCDDDEWEEIRNFMKSLTRMYHDQGRDVIFYENAAAPHRHPHAAMTAVPIPYEEGETIPAYFKEAFLTADEEWSQHRKIIDTGAKAKEGLGKAAFRRSIAKEMPYFHVWFTLDGGLGHIVEDSNRWPKGDLFLREVIGGVLDVGPEIIKKQGRWRKGDGRVDGFKKRWRKFDWTRVLEG